MTSPLEDQVRQVFAAQARTAVLPTEQVLADVRAQAAVRRRRRRYAGSGLTAALAAGVAAVALQPAHPSTRPSTQPARQPAAAPADVSPSDVGPADVSSLADRVEAVIAQDRLEGLSAMSTDPNGRVDVWWVGPIPRQLRLLAEQSGGPRLVIRPGTFTADQLLAATERVVAAFSAPRLHPAWALASVTPTPTGNGIRVGLARPGGGLPQLSAAELASVRRQLAAVAGEVPVVDVLLVADPATAGGPPGVKVPTYLRTAEPTARPMPT